MSRPTPPLRAGLACDDFSGDRALEKGNGAGEKHRVDDVAASGGAVPAGSVGGSAAQRPPPRLREEPGSGTQQPRGQPKPGAWTASCPAAASPPAPTVKPGPRCSWVLKYYFYTMEETVDKKKKASLLIFLYVSVFMSAERRVPVQGTGVDRGGWGQTRCRRFAPWRRSRHCAPGGRKLAFKLRRILFCLIFVCSFVFIQ